MTRRIREQRNLRRPVRHRRGYSPILEVFEKRQLLAAGVFLQGTTFNDANGNGVFDSNESALSGATVDLFYNPVQGTGIGTEIDSHFRLEWQLLLR